MTDIFSLVRGGAPLIISIPHLGITIPEDLRDDFSDVALTLADTDWHLDQLYDFGHNLSATIVTAKVSRYVIDLNRPPSDESLYPGQVTTGLYPAHTFRGESVYRDGRAPDTHEKARRLRTYWRPYHECLAEEIRRLCDRHQQVLLWEAHSIASCLPRLFDGTLHELNLGNQDGRTCDSSVFRAAVHAASESGYTWVANGRFKGGYITRHYGAPSNGIHAIQLEMSQRTYMEESAPFRLISPRAKQVKATLQTMVMEALESVARMRT
ncbi:N-formylglutamate deformylase [Paraburkholderia youngii]|uniref:N-formylglutamate deformylase n=1 Tax=Paraburkholderia youngii TaxID=2782701 RepID=UPI003D1A33FC